MTRLNFVLEAVPISSTTTNMSIEFSISFFLGLICSCSRNDSRCAISTLGSKIIRKRFTKLLSSFWITNSFGCYETFSITLLSFQNYRLFYEIRNTNQITVFCETFLSQWNKTWRYCSTSGFTSGVDHFDNRTCTTSTFFTHLLDISLAILSKVWKQSIIYINFWCFIFILIHCESFSSSRTSISFGGFDFNVFKIPFINIYTRPIFSVRPNWAWYCPSSDSCPLWNRLSKDEIESAKLAHDYDD